jgi:predicted DNA-binding ribbon-helix-helix protein
LPASRNLYVPDGFAAASTLVIRNVTIAGRRTSVRLEPEMWSALGEICEREGRTTHQVCSLINERKHIDSSLTAAIRVFIMAYFRAAATEEGHHRAGHGSLFSRGPLKA